MGFGLWIDAQRRLAWAQGTHEYRPMGTAVIAASDVFRPRDFDRRRACPRELCDCFVGFFGSLEEVNYYLRSRRKRSLRSTPYYVR